MQYIIHIDSSHNVCSVTISNNAKEIVGYKEITEPNKHSQLLSVYVDELLSEHSIDKGNIVAVALSHGPGSYTGLRIGASLAKGICYGLSIPLVAIDTLAIMASWFVKNNQEVVAETDVLCPMIDARRMEVYVAKYSKKGEELSPVNAVVVDESSFEKDLSNSKVHFFGNGASKCSEVITSENAIFHDEFQLSSRGMVDLSWNYFEAERFEDIAYYEPLYLKEFIATVSKKSVFK